jgi:hypothetical protein
LSDIIDYLAVYEAEFGDSEAAIILALLHGMTDPPGPTKNGQASTISSLMETSALSSR